MHLGLVLFLAIFVTGPAVAEQLQRGNITSCAYQAGTAYEIQKIRQTEGDDWQAFSDNINKIYSDSQGREDLLAIAKRVYINPADKSADKVHDEIFKACVARQQGTEPIT